MRLSHIILTIVVMAIWGFSFIAFEEGLLDMPPLLLSCCRFFFTSIPAIFFIKKPNTSWLIIASYGLCMFALMSSFTFFSMNAGITAGLAALLIQSQAFFTILLSVIFFKEKINNWQIIGSIISFSSLGVIGIHVGGELTLLGFILIIAAAFSRAVANLISKQAGDVNMLALIVWGSLFSWPPLLAFSFLFEGGDKIFFSLQNIRPITIAALIYMIYPATLLGFSIWAWLLNRYHAATIAPFSLLIPFFGILSSMIIFNEPLQTWKIVAIILMVGGLCINLLGPRFKITLK